MVCLQCVSVCMCGQVRGLSPVCAQFVGEGLISRVHCNMNIPRLFLLAGKIMI